MTKQNKTVETDGSVSNFLRKVDHQQRKRDSEFLLELMSKITGEEAKMWGKSIVGFGKYHYKYKSGREGDFMKVGFSPRKQSMTLYIMPGFERYEDLLSQLGKHKTGKSCLYVNKLSVNSDVLEKLIQESFDYMSEKYG